MSRLLKRGYVKPDDTESELLQAYMAEVARTPLLAREEERDLAARVKTGNAQAREHLIKANLRLAVSMAAMYQGRGLGLMDLIQEANDGLLTAIKKYDVDRGVKFSTYALWWIRQSLERGVANNNHTIRQPVHVQEKERKRKNTIAHFTQQHGRKPTDAEIQQALGWSDLTYSNHMQSKQTIISLSAAVDDEYDSNYWMHGTSSVDDRVLTEERKALIAAAMATLEPDQRTVLHERFYRKNTLAQVGAKRGRTRERIRQIQESALKKMRQGPLGAQLEALK